MFRAIIFPHLQEH